jgi:ABC-type transport system involved in multi-copper enzyme maturation permease subunit
MKTILLIATDSIRSLLHHRLLLGLMLASLALTIFFSIAMSMARKNITASFSDQATINSVMDSRKMSEADRQTFRQSMEMASSTFQGFFYIVASFGGSLVALFIFGTAIATEIRKGTIRLTLSKPVSRTQFLLGKYMGGVAVMAGYALIASIAMLVFAHFQRMELSPVMRWAPWLMFCRQMMLGSVVLLLSLFVHPVIAAVLAFFSGNGLYSPPNPLYFILPSYSEFDVTMEVLSGTLIAGKDVALLSLYALDFVVIIMLLALWRFRTKDLI